MKLRIAPSPTGSLHIGNARTALFNWLYAKANGGTFVVRIDDTDIERSTEEFQKDILENLRWLGLDWDEGVEVGGEHGDYKQSSRFDSCLLYTSPSPRDISGSRMPSSA